jgi:hypothetical protein
VSLEPTVCEVGLPRLGVYLLEGGGGGELSRRIGGCQQGALNGGMCSCRVELPQVRVSPAFELSCWKALDLLLGCFLLSSQAI